MRRLGVGGCHGTPSPRTANRDRRGCDSRLHAGTTAAFVCALVLLPGCARGVRWELGRYEEVHRQAQAADQLTFAYFRNWYSVACTNFEEQILKDPDVLTLTDTMVCVPLDFDYDRSLARNWGVDRVPAFVIVAPDGRVRAWGQAPLTRQDVVDAINRARAQQANQGEQGGTAP